MLVTSKTGESEFGDSVSLGKDEKSRGSDDVDQSPE